MYLLYLDDAGDVKNPRDNYFILAGIAVFERQVEHLQDALDRLASHVRDQDPDAVEFQGNAILSGRGWWRSIRSQERRDTIILDGLDAAQSLAPRQWRLFGAAVDKRAISPEDAIEYAFTQMCDRFDKFLRRLYREGIRQKGLIVLDKSAQETRLQSLASEFRAFGHRYGDVVNLVDVPFFVDSKATRCIQYADLVAYAMWRKYEQGDARFFDAIAHSFDSEGGIVHGLHHYRNLADPCDCPGCTHRISEPSSGRL